jgi:SM-20-related protein
MTSGSGFTRARGSPNMRNRNSSTYRPGDFFAAHQDRNTPRVRDTRFREVSVIIFLNRQSTEPAPGACVGGSLVLHEPFPQHDVRRRRMRVIPVTHGERYTIVSWYR